MVVNNKNGMEESKRRQAHNFRRLKMHSMIQMDSQQLDSLRGVGSKTERDGKIQDKPSAILAFSVADKRDAFMHNHLPKAKKVLEQRIDSLILEQDQFLIEIIKFDNLLRKIGADMQAFGYHRLLAKKARLLTQGIRQSDYALSLVHKTLYDIETILYNVNKTLDSSCKTIRELEASLSKACKGWKKAQNDLLGMHCENINLFKKYVNSVERGYSVLYASFKNTMKQVEFFHPGQIL